MGLRWTVGHRRNIEDRRNDGPAVREHADAVDGRRMKNDDVIFVDPKSKRGSEIIEMTADEQPLSQGDPPPVLFRLQTLRERYDPAVERSWKGATGEDMWFVLTRLAEAEAILQDIADIRGSHQGHQQRALRFVSGRT